jgi:sugar phosphate isomerase/epimerase
MMGVLDSKQEKPILCYCSNAVPIGRGGSATERLAEMASTFRGVRDALELPGDVPLHLGLWIDAETAAILSSDKRELASLRRLLEKSNLRVATLNAFPFGTFHGKEIKTAVYLPDWTGEERVEYTIRCAEILDGLPLSDNGTAPISTLPGGYRAAFDDIPRAERKIAGNILRTAEALLEIREKRGVNAPLAVEMEPDCLWETPAEFADFHGRLLSGAEAAEMIGVCHDTCHQELVEGSPGSALDILASSGIQVLKIQASAAIQADIRFPEKAAEEFADLAENSYLHQTRVFRGDGSVSARFPDIPSDAGDLADAFAAAGSEGKAVAHFHVPLHLDELGGALATAREELRAALSAVAAGKADVPVVEIETYTYAVLPERAARRSVPESIAMEMAWTKERLEMEK